MADSEFEEFRQCFDKLPQHIRAPAPFYSLVQDVIDDVDASPTSSKSGEEDDTGCDYASSNGGGSGGSGESAPSSLIQIGGSMCLIGDNNNVLEDNNYGILRTRATLGTASITTTSHFLEQQQQHQQHYLSQPQQPAHYWIPTGERRRRRLPEIPKSKRVSTFSSTGSSTSLEGASLASELASIHQRPTILRNMDSSPDSERHPYTDVDSGHSTAHSPIDGAKSVSPPFGSHFEMLEPTHRGLHKFVPRHRDEIDVEIGDPIYVQKEADDLWCEGVNLRTGRSGIFPSAYAVDMDYSEFDPACEQSRRERYLLGYLGSVETLAHKGTQVVCQATRRVAESQVHACILEVSDRGLRMVDRTKPTVDQPCIDYFYSLKNVSFCAFHPRDHRYLGFITKHPTLQRFACHIFRGNESTRPVAEAVGRAFQRFYQKFIETAYPIEDIYIE